MKNRRKLILVPLAAVAVALAFASVAYACTVVVGSITTTYNGNTCSNSPPSCQTNTGDTVTSTGNTLNVRTNPSDTRAGAPDGTQWSLYFLQHKSYQDGMKTCMGRGVGPTTEEKIGMASPAQSGNSVTVSGTIPNKPTRDPEPVGSALGPALVCLLSEDPVTDEVDYNYATPSTELTVV